MGDFVVQLKDLNKPSNFDCLKDIDQLLVHQKVELLEALCGFETNNKYQILNNSGEKLWNVKEGPIRSFDLNLFDDQKNKILNITRPLRCQSCCYPCCLQRCEVTSADGSVLGYIEQVWSFWTPKFNVCDATGETVLRIVGPCWTFGLCWDVDFKVYSCDGETQIGRIAKKWSGCVKECCTDADNFGVSFPMDLDVNLKAVLLGACFLIDFMYFEETQVPYPLAFIYGFLCGPRYTY
ncbi:phospholipid scramblase 2-like [Panonychus citri]|uniref:phospholipid scramblase 2-like n=1 Tax=Panonychus citri TaxID=50023 RepID=UPI0023078337|nr:phospholipid scramblase 2-like [Panonychus citri]